MEIFERLTKKSGTHGEITKNAISLLESIGQANEYESFLIAASDDPDEKPIDLWIGHFYGKQSDIKCGSYVSIFIGGVEINALNNFSEWYKATKNENDPKKRAKKTGSTLHYIQDLTAPHHFHNLPAKISKSFLGWDTHVEFEKKAKQLINNTNFIDSAKQIFDQLGSFDDPALFAIKVNDEAIKVVPDLHSLNKEDEWEKIINQLLPLAIAASAKVILSFR